jgi:hypothetical protein
MAATHSDLPSVAVTHSLKYIQFMSADTYNIVLPNHGKYSLDIFHKQSLFLHLNGNNSFTFFSSLNYLRSKIFFGCQIHKNSLFFKTFYFKIPSLQEISLRENLSD